jgi:hypothetical protein
MKAKATIYTKRVTGPATHAIVIGVGHYLHLPGGGGKKYPNPSGLRQLKSPPQSARAMARWLLEDYRHPGKPLASLSLLLSDSTDSRFKYTVNGHTKTVTVPPATIQEVQNAIRNWHQLGHENPDHLLLFFFCGHGIARAPDLALLLSDFGAAHVAPLDGAIDFRRLRQGMDECEAREQCYFVDACRVKSDLLIEGYAGNPIIHKTGTINKSGRYRQAPVLYSTLADAQAYALVGKPSLYTTALLEALAGAGCEEDYQSQKLGWRVRTTLVHHALCTILKEASERLRLPQLQIPPSDDLTTIDLNFITSPKVPVVVSCDPAEANSKATLTCQSAKFKKKRAPRTESWRLSLPVDVYDFSAKTATASGTESGYYIRPTFPQVKLNLTK